MKGFLVKSLGLKDVRALSRLFLPFCVTAGMFWTEGERDGCTGLDVMMMMGMLEMEIWDCND